MIDKIGASPSAAAPHAAKLNDPARVKDAACQFEALLIGQLMKSMRDSSSGWLDDGDDQAGATATDMAEEQFAKSLASHGGLGLARMVVCGLEKSNGSGT